MLTGSLLPGGEYLFVLDVDEDRDGDLSLKEVEENLGELPETLTVKTGSGWHYYFTAPKQLKNSVNKIGKGIDIRGVGGFVIGPGSVHYSGASYTMELGLPEFPLTAPDWLIELAVRDKPLPDHIDIGEADLVHGGRNDALTRLAGSMRYKNMSEKAVYAALAQVNLDRCKPPLDDEEVRRIASSAERNFDFTVDVKELALQRNRGGHIICNEYNASLMIANRMPKCIGYNERLNQVEWTGEPEGINVKTGDALKDSDLVEVQGRLGKPNPAGISLSFPIGVIHAAVRKVAEENSFDPIAKYLKSLNWDGKNRIRSLFPKYFGSDDTMYEQVVGEKLMLALVARGLVPGYKIDTVWVLEGRQGIGKSVAVSVLGGDYNHSGVVRFNNKDMVQEMSSAWTYELAEWAGLQRYTPEEVKAFLSKTEDKVRLPYAREPIVIPRGCVFIATTNQDAYLNDDENRRYLPVRCKKIDISGLKKDKDKLFAEAVAKFRAGELPYVDAGEDLPPGYKKYINAQLREVAERNQGHPWADIIESFIERKFRHELSKKPSDYFLTSKELMSGCLDIPAKDQNLAKAKTLSNVMRRIGWKRHRTSNARGFAPSKEWIKMFDEERKDVEWKS